MACAIQKVAPPEFASQVQPFAVVSMLVLFTFFISIVMRAAGVYLNVLTYNFVLLATTIDSETFSAPRGSQLGDIPIIFEQNYETAWVAAKHVSPSTRHKAHNTIKQGVVSSNGKKTSTAPRLLENAARRRHHACFCNYYIFIVY